MNATIAWHNAGPDTIWAKLAARLGREPTHGEAKQEVRSIIERSLIERAEAGKLKRQRR